MSKTILSRIPEFYSDILLDSVNPALVANHSTIIREVAKEEGLDFKLNLVRIFLNKDSKKSQKCNDKLAEVALSIDPTFVAKKKNTELRAIAGMTILHLLSLEDSPEIDLTALALKCGSFLNTDFANSIHDEIGYLSSHKAISKRSPQGSPQLDISQLENDLGAEYMSDQDSIDDRFLGIENYLLDHNKGYLESIELRLMVLEEESNIQWYLFRGYSQTAKAQFKLIEKPLTPWIFGAEISRKIRILPEPPSVQEFIEYGLDVCSIPEKSEFTVLDFVNTIPEDLLLTILNGFEDQIHGSFCPLLFAAFKRNESDKESWVSAFEKATLIRVATKVSAKQLAYQVFLECLFIREMKKFLVNGEE